jgi:hypothetical protein
VQAFLNDLSRGRLTTITMNFFWYRSNPAPQVQSLHATFVAFFSLIAPSIDGLSVTKCQNTRELVSTLKLAMAALSSGGSSDRASLKIPYSMSPIGSIVANIAGAKHRSVRPFAQLSGL